MTEDYKMITKDFIAKSLTLGNQGTWELFYGHYSGIASIYENYDNNAVIKCVKQVVSPKNVGVMWTIIVLWSNTLLKGRFAILDENNEVVSTIDQYTSEVDIGCYYCIDLDEKGRLYGIEWFNQERVRFIMLNNISIPMGEEYYADIRKAYDVPTLNGNAPVQNSSTIGYIKQKDSKYGICLCIGNDFGETYSFEINIGTENVWKECKVASVMWESQHPYIKFDNNDMLTFKIIGNQHNSIDPVLKYDVIVENDTTLTNTSNTIFSNSNGKTTLTDSDIWWIDENNILVPFYDDTKMYLQKLDLSGDTFTNVYEENFYTQQLQVKFSSVNNYCYMHCVGKNYNAPGTTEEEQVDVEGFKQAIYHIFKPDFSDNNMEQNIYEHIIQEETSHSTVPSWFGIEYFLVQNQYNLYNYIYSIILEDNGNNILYVDVSQEIYNENNYNGNPYIPLTNQLEPKQFILKNGDKILYARDVYNKTAYENIIDSSLHPNVKPTFPTFNTSGV